MKSPWKSLAELDADREYVTFASAIPITSWKATPKMFRGASKVRRQLDDTNGLIGYSLLAEPLKKRYATLSVWDDQAALDRFVRQHPHDELRTELSPLMGDTRFTSWTITGSNGIPSWEDALDRLA